MAVLFGWKENIKLPVFNINKSSKGKNITIIFVLFLLVYSLCTSRLLIDRPHFVGGDFAY